MTGIQRKEGIINYKYFDNVKRSELVLLFVFRFHSSYIGGGGKEEIWIGLNKVTSSKLL